MSKIEGPNFEGDRTGAGDTNYAIPKAIPEPLERILRSIEKPIWECSYFPDIIAKAVSENPSRVLDFNTWLKRLERIEPATEELAVAEQDVDEAINLALGRHNPN